MVGLQSLTATLLGDRPMTRKMLTLTVAAAALTASAFYMPKAVQAQQAEVGSIHYLGLTDEEFKRDRRHWARYFEYEHRENCQKYVAPPEGFIRRGCTLERVAVAEAVTEVVAPAAVAAEPPPAPAPKTSTLYFHFDKSNIPGDAAQTLPEAVTEITSRKPSMVTVSGHADKAGPDAYNDALSERRTDAVSDALTAAGIDNKVIKEQSFGEHQPAVNTPDGQPEQKNRRVTIDFQ